jgi:lysozyme
VIFNRLAMVSELVADENLRFTTYDDATGQAIRPGDTIIGHPTIGVGRTLDTKGLSRAESLYLLDNDISEYLAELEPFAWFQQCDGGRQRAVVNMRHQLGLAGLLNFRVMIGYITVRDWSQAVTAAENSRWFRETPMRAKRVLSLLLDGDGPPDPPAG